MKLVCALAVAGAAMVSSPAAAAEYFVTIQGNVAGLTTTVSCTDGGSFPTCTHQQTTQSPFSASVSYVLGTLNLAEGLNTFSTGQANAGSGYFSGTILNEQGVLTGLNLNYAYQPCSNPCGTSTSAFADRFVVTGGVPEPSTWALMLIGFGSIGSAMRRRRNFSSAPSYQV